MYMNENEKEIKGNMAKIHRVLAHSYTLYLIATLLGFFLYGFSPITKIVTTSNEIIGIIFMSCGTLLILWAQSSSDKSKIHRNDKENLKHHHFAHGPYAIFRSPTNQGLFMTLFGFGFLLGSLEIITISLITFLLARYIFIEKEENILIEKYGKAYEDYQKKTKL